MRIKGFFKYMVLMSSLNSVPVFSDNLLYPVESTPDAGTVLDEKKSARVRKLLEYAITRNKQKGVIEYVEIMHKIKKRVKAYKMFKLQ